jgi:hypothetical protein
VGWDREFNNITEPITIKAIWQLDETSETTTSETSVTPEETTTTEAPETEPPVTSVTTTTEASETEPPVTSVTTTTEASETEPPVTSVTTTTEASQTEPPVTSVTTTTEASETEPPVTSVTTTTEAPETEPPVTSVTTTTEASQTEPPVTSGTPLETTTTTASETQPPATSQTPAQTTTPPTTTPAQTTNSRIIQNDDASIIFDLSDAILPEGVTGVSMDIEHVKPSESEESGYRLVKKLIDDNATIANLQNLVLYDLKLVDLNGNPITNFEGIIKVKLRIPEGMSGDLRVYWYNTDTQELVDMNAVIEGDYLVFETDHFSYYAIAQIATEDPPSVNPDTGSGMLAVWWLFSAIPLTASIVLGTKTKKKHS